MKANNFIAVINTWIPIGILLMLTGCSSCTKEKDTTIYIEPQLKAGLFFQSGTYWIMKDSATGALDSFYVTVPAYSQTVPNGPHIYTERVGVGIDERGTYNGLPLSMHWSFNIIPNLAEVAYYDNAGANKIYGNAITIPLQTHIEYLNSQNHTNSIDSRIEQTITIEGESYNSVYITTNYFDNGFTATTFMNLDAGLIKIVQKDSYYARSLSLVRYHAYK